MVKAAAAMTPLYEQPMLVVDPDMHTARVNSVAVDAAGRLVVTGSWDKTVRVWSLADGQLLRTIRMAGGARQHRKYLCGCNEPRWRSCRRWRVDKVDERCARGLDLPVRKVFSGLEILRRSRRRGHLFRLLVCHAVKRPISGV